MSRTPALLAAAWLALGASGCGVSSWVTADEAKHPISMSNGLRDQNGELVKAENKQVVGEFEDEYLACSMLWRMLSFTGDHDISEDVNEKVKAAGGNAVTNLSVESSGTVWTMTTLLGIFPDCANVKVRGKIVKVTTPEAPRAKPAPAAAPSPPAAEPAPVPAPAAAAPAARPEEAPPAG